MALALALVVIDNQDFAIARNHHVLVFDVGHIAQSRQETDSPGGLPFQLRGGSRTRGRATDVEGSHGQLSTWLADRLSGDHADRLAGIDQISAPQIAPVTLGA